MQSKSDKTYHKDDDDVADANDDVDAAAEMKVDYNVDEDAETTIVGDIDDYVENYVDDDDHGVCRTMMMTITEIV